MVMIAISILLAAQAAPSAPPQPMEPATSARGGDVVVTGVRDRFRIDERALRAAQSAFAAQRARYAPDATLRFVVQGIGPATAPSDQPLRLVATDGTRRISIDLAADGAFDVPALPAGWWVEANRSPRSLRVEPLTLSPASSRRDYRLGDARLQCRVFWAMEKATAPLLVAPIVGMFDLAGPCTSRRLDIFMAAPATVRAASVQDGAQQRPLRLSRSRRFYHPPVNDKALGDESRVQVVTD